MIEATTAKQVALLGGGEEVPFEDEQFLV